MIPLWVLALGAGGAMAWRWRRQGKGLKDVVVRRQIEALPAGSASPKDFDKDDFMRWWRGDGEGKG